ncbi:MAG TPA: hypothetical protein ENN99_09715, partial [Chloroflexi bacterium]|nr:hypothetical protein [Chloroflexota bacterium]
MPEDKQSDENSRRPEFVQPLHPPAWWNGEHPRSPEPAPELALSPDDIETGEVPGKLGDPTLPKPRLPTGLTPTAGLPRPVPPPQRPGYV